MRKYQHLPIIIFSMLLYSKIMLNIISSAAPKMFDTAAFCSISENNLAQVTNFQI